jgi:four helix bundle protein
MDYEKLPIRNYRDLIVWQKSMEFVKNCYELSETFPAREIYGLSQQLRKAAVSVPSNIAEGNGREGIKDYIHFLNISRGSLKEAETQLILAELLGFINTSQLEAVLKKAGEIGFMLNNLIRSLKKHILK